MESGKCQVHHGSKLCYSRTAATLLLLLYDDAIHEDLINKMSLDSAGVAIYPWL